MDCAGCGRTNRDGARFCGGCGRPLAPRCPACAAEVEAGALFCDACGAPLRPRAASAAAAEARKVVTIVFADLVGSTALHERLDPESARAFMERYYRAMTGAVEAERGRVTQLLGDGVKAVFGAPRVAEDDAIRAVRAAAGMQRAFRALADAHREAVGAVGLRVAVNTGEVIADGESEIIGDPVNVAAHLQQQARDGDVLVGESTQRLVSQQATLEPFGTFALKGRAEPVTAWRVKSLERPAGAPASAFVGRDDELRRIAAVHEQALAEPRAKLAVILGSPGLGKSRLLAELTRRLGGDGATVLAARCDATGGATFAPLARALRTQLGVDESARGEDLRVALDAVLTGDAERGRIAGGIASLLAGAPAPPEETFFAVRRFLAALAAKRPVLLAIDDLHWAEPLLLDLVEHLVQWSGGVPLFILAAARPELRELRSSLATSGGLVAEVVVLSGLDAGAATRLAANVIGADALPAAVAGRVLATSEGNPLFVGELVRMLVDDGALVREGERWVAGAVLAEIEMPPTIHALLAARIERLRPEERTLLERASVVGRHFSRAAVAELVPEELRGELDARLESLRRSELIEPDTGWFLGEPGLRFHHVLTRDAAYRRLLKGTRAELHARFADWLVTRAGGDDAGLHDETLGWHLEQAHQHLLELGPLDARGRELGLRAARHLAAAGRRAFARDDLPLAAGLLGRAQARLDAQDPARADLLLDWCESLLATGDVGPAAAAVAELGRLGAGTARLRAWHTCFAGQLAVLTDPRALHATADAVAAAAGELAAAGDTAGEAKAHSVHALALGRLGKIGACEAALDRALAAARRARDRRLQNAVLTGAPIAALWGPSPVTRASGRCLDVVRVLRITQGAPAVEAVALCCQAVLEALRGRSDAARRMIASARRLIEELGITQRLLETDVFAGQIELLEGADARAERCLRSAYQGLREHGLRVDAAQAAALLGRALLAQGRADEADALSRESEALAGDDLKAAIAWRGVRAEALARRGLHAEAEQLARAAVEIAAATDALLDHADARSALAAALRAAGRGDEAAAEEARAVALWEQKGASVLVARARTDAAPPVAAAVPAALAPRRRVRPNAASAFASRLDAVVAARDVAGLEALFADDMRIAHHATGTQFGREGALSRFAALMRAEGLHLFHEPIATLGASLALCRASTSVRSLAEDDIAPAGAIDSETRVVIEVDAQGREQQVDIFPADRLGDAIARLYERHAELLAAGPAHQRAAATARSVAAFVTPDPEVLPAIFAPDAEYVDHRVFGVAGLRGVDAIRGWGRSLFESADEIVFRLDEILDLRSDAFLVRFTNFGRDRASGGRFERQFLSLAVFGVDGLVKQWEHFDAEREGEPLGRFDALTSAPTPARFENATSRAQADFERHWRERDWEAVAQFPPGFQLEDRRSVVGIDLSGDAFLANLRMLWESCPIMHTDVLATRGERIALWRARWSGEVGGGPFEVEQLSVGERDAEGRIAWLAVFDLGDEDAAWAELDRRFAEGEGAPHAELLAGLDAFWRHGPASGREDVMRLLAGDFHFASHRRPFSTDVPMSRSAFIGEFGNLTHLGVDSTGRVDHLRVSNGSLIAEVLWSGTREGGRFEVPLLFVFSHAGGSVHSLDLYDADQQDAAFARYAELSALEAVSLRISLTRSFGEAFAARDWQALSSLLAPEVVVNDHRRLGWETLHGQQAYLDALRSLVELAPDVSLRTEHVEMSGPGYLYFTSWQGTREGGAFEEPSWIVCELDAEGRILRFDQYDLDEQPAARARLAEIGAGAAHDPLRIPPNAASRVSDRFQACADAGDWAALRALFAPAFVLDDRRALFRLTQDLDSFVAGARLMREAGGARVTRTLLATAGDRLSLDRVFISHAGSAIAEVELLMLRELDADGLTRTVISFDPGDRRAASAEMRERFFAGEAADWPRDVAEVQRAWNENDLARLRAALPDDFWFHDHRRTGAGRIEGADAYVRSVAALFEQARVMNVDQLYHVAVAPQGSLAVTRTFGELGSGSLVESVFVRLSAFRDGRFAGLELFELEDLERARARFEALRPPDVLRIPPNAATRSMERMGACIEAQDWQGLADLFPPDFAYDDRRPLVRDSGDREKLLASVRVSASVGASATHALLATAGDRLALGQIHFSMRQEGALVSELETLQLVEVDAQGRFVAHVIFDPGDRRAASLEMFERHARGPAAGPMPPAALEALRAMNAHDLERLRAVLPDDFVFDDHRRTGLGRLGSAAFVGSLAPLFDQAPDLTFEALYTIASEKHGELAMARVFGTLANGGAVESAYLRLELWRGDRIAGMELFEPEDLERARARLDAFGR